MPLFLRLLAHVDWAGVVLALDLKAYYLIVNYLPFADSSAHAVVMNQVLHHAEQPGEVLKEVHRILTDDGILIIADLTRHEHDWARERLADQWLGFSPEELENWLADTDMKVVSYQEYGDEKNQQSVFLLAAGSS